MAAARKKLTLTEVNGKPVRPSKPAKSSGSGKLTLTSVNGKKVNSPKGTKTVTSSGGKLVYKDKHGKPIKRGR